MPEGKCPNCGTIWHGWALTGCSDQSCPKCGAQLEMIANGCTVREEQLDDDTEKPHADSTPDVQSEDEGKYRHGQ